MPDSSRDRGQASVRRIRTRPLDTRLGLAGIVLAAIALRFVAVGAHLSIDDGYSYLVGSAPSGHAFLARLAASENTPPLFYLLLAPLPLGHAAWVRLPAAIPGVMLCLALFVALRRPLGSRVALLSALAVAVAPLLVTYSNLARGFMLEDLALVVALWAVLRLGERASLRWWLLYVGAGVVALYTEYDSAIFLVALTATALWVGTPDRRRMAAVGLTPLLALGAWIPQIVRAQDAVNRTKLAPKFAGPSLGSLRDATVTLALGENGGTTNSFGRWLELCVCLALAALVLIALRRSAARRPAQGRRAIVLLAGTAALTLVGHAIAAAVSVNVFDQRYLTIMIPLAAALGAAAICSTNRRSVSIGAALLLATLGILNLVRRYHHEWEPDLRPVRLTALRLQPRTVLTDNPVVVYYLKSLRPQLDRPFDLGPGRAQSCARPCLIVDDLRTRTGSPRRVAGSPTRIGRIGPFELTLEH